MTTISGTVVSVHAGNNDDMSKDQQESIRVELDGIVGDAHRSLSRKCWAGGDKQPEGTERRNERTMGARPSLRAIDVPSPDAPAASSGPGVASGLGVGGLTLSDFDNISRSARSGHRARRGCLATMRARSA